MVCRTPDFVTAHDGEEAAGTLALRLVSVSEYGGAPRDDLRFVPKAIHLQRAAEARARRSAKARARSKRIEGALLSVTAAVALAATIAGGVHLIQPAQPVGDPARLVLVTVAPGDTLWKLAQRYGPAESSTSDRLQTIESLNPSLSEGKALRVGQQILVPSDNQATRLASAGR